MEYSAYSRLNKKEVMSFLNEDDKILFLGPGNKLGLNELLAKDYKVHNIDLVDKPVNSTLSWSKSNVNDADFDEYKEYNTVIIQRLCDKELHASMPWHLLPRLVGFEKIIIEFCSEEEHYVGVVDGVKLKGDRESIRITASKCEEFLRNNGYSNRVIYNDSDGLRLKLFSSINGVPRIVKPELCNGFCDPGFPPWYGGDGSYYD